MQSIFPRKHIRAFSFLVLIILSVCPFSFVSALQGDDGIPLEVVLGRNQLSTRDRSGAFEHTIPVVIPPGRNGLQPDLQLVYSSREDELNNLFGYGWSINVPYIQRINKKGVEDLYTTDYFFSSLDGELATTTTATSTKTFAPRIENGSFLSYSLTNNVWTVYDKKGTRYSFGTTTSSRMDNVASTTQVYRWYLEEVRDTNDNYIKYEYFKDNGQVYPATTTYTGSGATDGIFKVEFVRSLRTDTATSTAAGFSVKSKYIVNEIDVKTNNVITRKYVLSTTTADNSARLLVSGITETGYTETGTPTPMPTTTISYQTPTKSWTQNGSYTVPTIFSRIRYDQGMRLGDANGDGLLDLIKSAYNNGGTETTVHEVYINKGDGTGWALDNNYSIPVNFTSNEYDQGVILDDMDGDGFTDIIQSFKDYGGTDHQGVYINKRDGTGWVLSASTTIPMTFLNSQTPQGVRTGDVNGDGLVDLVQSYNDNEGHTYAGVYLNNGNGTGWTQNTNYSIPIDFQIGGGDVGTRLIDINNDGTADILKSYENYEGVQTRGVYINKGDSTGWTLTSTTSIPIIFTRLNVDRGVRLGDVNGDGLVDIVQNYYDGSSPQKGAYLNTGNATGWVLDSSYTLPGDYFTYGSADYGVRFADIDGDGLSDIFRSYKNDDGSEVKSVQIRDGVRADLVKRIGLPEGGSITTSYKNTPQYRDGAVLSNPKLPLVLNTIQAIGRSDGLGNVATTTFSYGGGLFYFNNPFDRRFAGFATTTKTDAAGNVTKEYLHQGDASNASVGEYSDHISKAGKVYRTEKYDNSSNLYQKIIQRWDRYNQGTNRDFVKLATSTDFAYDGNAGHKDMATEFSYDNTNGNLTAKTMWGEVTGSDDGTFSDVGSDKAVETISYATSSGNLVVGLQVLNTVVDQSAAKVRESRTYYDTLALGTASAGNPTKIEQWKSASTYIDTQKTYNAYGLVATSTDARGKATGYQYDTFNLYPATTTNPLNQKTGHLYDYSAGKVKRTADPNGLIFQTTYDGLDRVLEEKQPEITSPSSLVTKQAYTYTDTSGAKSILRTDYLSSATSSLSHQYFDGLNRLIQERKEAETANEYNVKDLTYNNRGLLYKESLPYANTGSSKTSATSTTALYSTYTYDSLQRILSAANAVGTTTYSYDNWAATTTDASSKSKGYYKDAYGNLARVNEVNSGSTYGTLYEWDLNNKLTKITDALSNIRTFTYDGLGRRLTATDLHAQADGAYGTSTYAYDDAGNLTQMVDPKSQTVNYTYDDTNRVLTEDYTGSGGTETTYAYDSCDNGIGHICSAATSDITTTFGYDPLGRTDTEDRTIGGTTYSTTYTRDRLGNLTNIGYPDNSAVKYDYNDAGLLEKIARKPANSGLYLNAIVNLNYAPTGAISLKQFGNGATTTYTYDPAHLYRLTNILTLGPIAWEGGGSLGLGFMPDSSWASRDQYLAKAEKQLLAIETEGLTLDLSTTTPVSEPEPPLLETETPSLDETPQSEEQTPESPAPVEEPAPVEVPAVVPPPAERISNLEVPDRITAPAPSSRRAMLADKSPLERADIKATEIVSLNPVGEYESKEYGVRVEIQKVEKIDGGVQVFARAWKDGKQLGFGSDGTTDIERFRIFNPPILVQDPLGDDMVKEITYRDGTKREVRYKEDPLLAFQQTLVHTISLVGKNDTEITSGSVGNTTDTFFSNASGDGRTSTNEGTFADNRAGTGTFYSVNTSGASQIFYEDTNYAMSALYFPFDTSSISSGATVSAATFSVYGDATGMNTPARGVGLLQSAQASLTALTTSDWVPASYTEIATRKNIASLSTGAYNDYALTNLAVVAKGSGFTKLMLLNGPIIDNDSVSGSWYFAFFMSDQSGTTNDPKLVVVHTVSNIAPSAPTSLEAEGQTDPTKITDSTPELSAIYIDADTSDVATSYQIQVATSTTFTSTYWDSAKTTLASSTPQGTRIAPISYAGSALASSTTYYWRIRLWDTADAQGAWSTATSTFSLNGVPTAPTSLLAEGQTDPTNITDPTPEFSAIYNDPDTGDVAIEYQIQVATSTAFTSNVWDSTKTALSSSTTQGGRSPDISYAGSALASSTTYYWRIKFWDTASSTGAWSTATSTFSLAASGAGGCTSAIQNISFAYDSVGNITTITDCSNTDASKTVSFTYDDLYRLATASTTAASSTPYSQSYTYDALGNITRKSDLGAYVYGGTGYANPHAVTDMASTTYAYDNNGNVTTAGSWAYTWDYRNRLTQASNGAASTYAYDTENQRIKKVSGGVTTTYPNKYFNKTGATTTVHIFLPDGSLVATVEGNGVATTTSYVHPDHLGSTNVVTDANGAVTQTLDYYPYGSTRVDSGTDVSQREFIGQFYDEESDLSYLNARYYRGVQGQFLSQDPTFLAVGSPDLADRMRVPESRDEEKRNKEALQAFLSDPQLANSYSYARNNPVTLKDETGEYVFLGPVAGAIISTAFQFTVRALTFIQAAEVTTLSYYDLRNGVTENRADIRNGVVELAFGPTIRGLGALAGTAKEIAQINVLVTTVEATQIIQAAPSAVRETYSNVRDRIQNFFNGGETKTHTTSSDAVVNSNGGLVSSPPQKN